MIPVKIIHICSAGNYVLIRNHPDTTGSIEEIKHLLNTYRFHDEDQFVPNVNQTVAVYSASDKQWLRAVVLNVDLKQRTCLIRYTEFGCTDTVTLLAVHPVPLDLDVSSIPAQTLDVTLCDVFPVEKNISGHYMQLQKWSNDSANYIREKYLRGSNINIMYEQKQTVRGQNFGKLWIEKSIGKRFSLGDRLVKLGRAIASDRWLRQVQEMPQEPFNGLTRGNDMFPRKIILETYRRRQQQLLSRSQSRHGRSRSEQRAGFESHQQPFQLNIKQAADKNISMPRRSKSLVQPTMNTEREKGAHSRPGREVIEPIERTQRHVDDYHSISGESDLELSTRREMETIGRRMERESRRDTERNSSGVRTILNEVHSRGNEIGRGHVEHNVRQSRQSGFGHERGHVEHSVRQSRQSGLGHECGHIEHSVRQSSQSGIGHELEALIRRENELDVGRPDDIGRRNDTVESPCNFDYFLGYNGNAQPSTIGPERDTSELQYQRSTTRNCNTNEKFGSQQARPSVGNDIERSREVQQSRHTERHTIDANSENHQEIRPNHQEIRPAAKKPNSLLSSVLEIKKPTPFDSQQTQPNERMCSDENTSRGSRYTPIENRHTPTGTSASPASLLQKILSRPPSSFRPIVKHSLTSVGLSDVPGNEPTNSLHIGDDTNFCSVSSTLKVNSGENLQLLKNRNNGGQVLSNRPDSAAFSDRTNFDRVNSEKHRVHPENDRQSSDKNSLPNQISQTYRTGQVDNSINTSIGRRSVPSVNYSNTSVGTPSSNIGELKSPTSATYSNSVSSRSQTPDYTVSSTKSTSVTPDFRSPPSNASATTPDFRSPPSNASATTPDFRSPPSNASATTPDFRSPPSNASATTPDFRSPLSNASATTPDFRSPPSNASFSSTESSPSEYSVTSSALSPSEGGQRGSRRRQMSRREVYQHILKQKQLLKEASGGGAWQEKTVSEGSGETMSSNMNSSDTVTPRNVSSSDKQISRSSSDKEMSKSVLSCTLSSHTSSNRETLSIVPLSNIAATNSSLTQGTGSTYSTSNMSISTNDVTNVKHSSSKTPSLPSYKKFSSSLLPDLIAERGQRRESVVRPSRESLENLMVVQPSCSDAKRSDCGSVPLEADVSSSSAVPSRVTKSSESTLSKELPEPVLRRLKSCLRSEEEHSRETRRSSDTKLKKVDTSMFAAFMKTSHATISDSSPQQLSSQPSSSKSLPRPSESVLNVCTPVVHSKQPVKIGSDRSVGAMENRLHYSIRENKQFPSVSLAQVASVPAILDHRNVAIIHTLKSHYNSAYLGSLISTLIEHKARYCNKKSFEIEPFVLILAPNSKVCDELYKVTTCFIDKFYDVTVKTIYGSSPENESKALLCAVNGCDILITTPRCLDRLKESHLVGLSWVFHYVLERADILFDKFSKEVLDFLGYLQVISKARIDKYSHLSHVSCPELQIILSAELYNKKLETFVLNKMNKPVLVFSNFLEAAIYGQVKFSLGIVSEMEKKMEHLLGILRSCRGGEVGEKVAIVCSDTSEVLCLDRYLSALYPHTFPIHSELNIIQLTNLVMKWRTMEPNRDTKCDTMSVNDSHGVNLDSMELYNYTPILICDDEALARSFVQDVTVLIHYSLPSNKKTMSDRFQLVKDGLINLFDDQDAGEVHCARCHLLLDDTNDVQFHDIVSLCKRIHLDIPDRIVQIAKQVKYKREAGKRNVPLCIQLLQFGKCHIGGGCKYRHAIVPDIDAPVPHLPKDGMIKFNVLSVLDGSCFSIRLLEKLPPGATTWIPYRDKLSLLNLALRRHYADKNNRVTHYSPRLGDVVAVERDGAGSAMIRARVIEIVSTDEADTPSLVRLRPCDSAGKPSVYSVSKLYALPQDLKLYSDQVLLAVATRVLPMDEDIQWNDEIVSYMESMIENLTRGEHDKYFVGKIVLSLNNIYLLDPFQCSEYLPSAKVEISHLRMRHSLLSTQRAIAHPTHLDLLYAQCAGVDGAVPEYMRDVTPQNVPLSPLVQLPSPKYAHLVQDEINYCTLIGIVHPSLFFLRLTSFEPMLIKLNKEILTEVNRTSTRYSKDQCSPGLLCLAPSDDKSGYNRVQITNTDDPNVAMVLFVDYSDKQDIPYDQLVPIYRPQLISNLPFQVIECCLAGVEPLDNNQWNQEAYDILDDFNKLFVRVVSLSLQGIESKGRRYSVELFDLEDRINVNKHLVDLNCAKYTEDSAVCLSQDDESVFTEIENLIEQKAAAAVASDDADDKVDGEEGDWQDLPDKQKYLTERQEMLNEKSSQEEEPLVIDESAFSEGELEEFVKALSELQPGVFPDIRQVDEILITKPNPVQDHLQALPSTSTAGHPQVNTSPTAVPLPNTSTSSKRVSNSQPSHYEDYSEPKLTLLPSDVDPNMPSLTIASYPARIQWYQTLGFVHLHLHLPGLHEKFTLRVESKFVHFYVDIEDRSYSNQLPLLCHIVPDLSELEWNGFEMRLKLVKQQPSLEWPALLENGLDREMRWLAYHVDHLCDHEPQDEAEISSDGEEPGPPVFRMKGLKHYRELEEEIGSRLSSEGEDNVVSAVPEDM